MKTDTFLFAILLGMAAAGSAQAQDAEAAQLRQAATGASFQVGDTAFRLAPSAEVAPVSASAPKDGLVVAGKYRVNIPDATARPTTGSTVKSPRQSPAQANAAPATKLAAAVSERGEPVVITSSLNVYFDQPSVLADAVRSTGGKLTYSSAIGGKGTIEFGSVAEAIKAMDTLQGKAGIKEVSPQLVQPRNMKH